MPDVTIDEQELTDLRARADAADSAAASAQEHQQRADTADAALRAGVDRYRDALALADPRIPADAIAGDSFDAVDAALANARRIADAATEAARAAAAPPAPPQTPAGGQNQRDQHPSGDGLRPFDRIRLGIDRRRGG